MALILRTLRTLRLPRSSRLAIRTTTTLLPRNFHSTALLSSKKDDLMDKDSINTTSTEYSKTGDGDSGAAHTDEAFDPSSTGPDEAGSQENSVSPGNPDVSKPRGDQEGGAERSPAEASGSRSQTSDSRVQSPKKNGS